MKFCAESKIEFEPKAKATVNLFAFETGERGSTLKLEILLSRHRKWIIKAIRKIDRSFQAVKYRNANSLIKKERIFFPFSIPSCDLTERSIRRGIRCSDR